jgi:hypothetical protein
LWTATDWEGAAGAVGAELGAKVGIDGSGPDLDAATPSHTMITGYLDEDDKVFCVWCWNKAKAIGGAASVLDMTDPNDLADTTPFWVVDPCVLCGDDVKYKDIKLLA